MRTRTLGMYALLAVLWCALSSFAVSASTTSRAEHLPGTLPALATTVPVSSTAVGLADTPTALTPSATSDVIANETPTLTPMPTSTGTAAASPSPSPTSSSSPTAVLTSTQTPIPAAIPTMSPMPAGVIAILIERAPMVAGGCLVLFLLVVGVALITWVLRRKKPPVPEAPSPAVPVAPYLESIGATGRTRRFDLTPGGVTIGRATDNDLVITQDFLGWETVSRHHARIRGQAGGWIVEDLDSMNGVYVNGRRTGRNLLREGWRLAIGGVEFVFRAGGGEA